MSSKISLVCLINVVLYMMSTSPMVAHGQSSPPIPGRIMGVQFTGPVLICPSTGRILSGVNATISCDINGDIMIVGNVTTTRLGINARLNLTGPPNLSIPGLIPNCTANVTLPIDGCSAFPLTGTLTATITFVGIFVEMVGTNCNALERFWESLRFLGALEVL
ncbi:hypothetical protein CQW23_06896 [Capsicum baccatum]|uniref:Phylloplanin n=1 Tax=Capsicum baccatum TaxID=33114 RepID=A0A2G2X4L0_CAPBA|nr:hypothetical protein CQW23_06896 [Capsicum baccatum]